MSRGIVVFARAYIPTDSGSSIVSRAIFQVSLRKRRGGGGAGANSGIFELRSCRRSDGCGGVERLVTSPGEEDASRRECRNRCEVNATEAEESLKNALDGRGGIEGGTVPLKGRPRRQTVLKPGGRRKGMERQSKS